MFKGPTAVPTADIKQPVTGLDVRGKHLIDGGMHRLMNGAAEVLPK